MTFLEIQTQVLDIIQELGNHPGYSLVKLKHYINRGYYDFVRQTKCLEGSYDITTVANQATYGYADLATLELIYIPIEVRYIDAGVTERGEALKLFPGGWTNLPETHRYGNPDYYWFRNVHKRQGIELGTYPISSTTGDTIRVYAYAWPSVELVADASYPEIKEAWHDGLTHYAAYRIYQLFSHLNPVYPKKAIEQKMLYEEFVREAREDMFIQQEEQDQIFDNYYDIDVWG